MALNAATVWEVRTTGNADNGGGFKTGATGVDKSQSDSAFITSTDGEVKGGVYTRLYSATQDLNNADLVGNIIKIKSGTSFTVGYYEITAVGNDGDDYCDIDRACATGNSNDATFSIGGALDHPNRCQASVVAGNKIYIKAGTYNRLGTNVYVLYLSVTGGNGAPIIWEGYNSTRGDAPTGTNRPDLNMGSTSNNVLLASGSTTDNNYFHYLRITGGTGSAYNGGGSTFLFLGCKISGAGTDGVNDTSGGSFFIDTEISNNSGYGLNSSTGGYTLINSYVHDNASGGFYVSSTGSLYMLGSIVDSNSGSGGALGSIGLIYMLNSIFYNNTGASSDGFSWAGSSAGPGFIYNTISVNNGRYGFNRTATTARFPYFDYNLYNGNGTAGLNNITAGSHDLTSAPSFTDAANGDFSLQAGSPAIDAGFPAHAMAGATV